MESLIWSPGDLSRLTSLSYKSSSLIIGTSTNQNDIMMRTNNMNALYISDAQDISIHTTHTRGRLNIGNANNHIVCYFNNDPNKYSTLAVDSNGSLRLSSVDSIYLDSNIYVLGQRLEASASELNYVHGIIPGIAAESKALILDESKSIQGLSDLSASTIHGTMKTPIQPYITEIGTLSSLSVENGIIASHLTGVLQTSDQSNITKVGTLQTLVVDGTVFASSLSGSLQTASQPNITSVGTLNTLSVANGISAMLVSASSYIGTLLTSAQPNITSVGKLTNLQASGTISTDGKVVSAIPIDSSSGGTGINQYAKGDILIGNDTNALSKVQVSSSYGSMLVADSSKSSGVSWDYNFVAQTYVSLGRVQTRSRTNYVFSSFSGMNAERTKRLDIPVSSVDLTTVGINGIAVSDNLTGTLYPGYTTTITGTATQFINEIPSIHSVIRVGNEFRKITEITSNNVIQINRPFTLLNTWTLGATGTLDTTNPKFGTGAFNGSNATTTNTTVVLGSPNRNHAASRKPWTLDMWFRFTLDPNTGVVQPITSSPIPIASSSVPFTLSVFITTVNGNQRLSVSIGEGVGESFNIATNRLLAGNLATGVYYHLAMVYSGSRYVLYLDGVEALVMNTSRALHPSCFDSFVFGSDGVNAFGGSIDEVRLSKVVRYAAAFPPITSAFENDTNTIFLNHFDLLSSVRDSDVTTLNEFSYVLDGGICPDTVYYCYAIANDITGGYVFSSSFARPPLSLGFTFKRIPFYVTSNSTSVFYASRYAGNRSSSGGMSFIQLMTPIPIISNATNVAPTILNTSLFSYVPQNTSSIVVLLTHNHATTISAGIVIGHNSSNLTTTLLSTSTASTIQIQYTIPINEMSIDTFFDANAAGSTYSVSICGFYTE